MQVTTSVEDYLKTIWKLAGSTEHVSTGMVAERRAVSPPSASIMVRRLMEAGLVARGPGADVRLTEDGETAALRVVRRHRLLETFLVEVCGLTWDEVDAEAEVLEHVLSPRLEARIDELLGHPTHDPHGDPIPQPRPAAHREAWSDPLGGAAAGALFQVDRVSDQDPAALRHLAAAGVVPGVSLLVGVQEPFGGPLHVFVSDPAAGPTDAGDRPVALPSGLVALIHGHAVTTPERPGASGAAVEVAP